MEIGEKKKNHKEKRVKAQKNAIINHWVLLQKKKYYNIITMTLKTYG
jgi:hypothetical protein